MQDKDKTKAQLIDELIEMRQRVTALEQIDQALNERVEELAILN